MGEECFFNKCFSVFFPWKFMFLTKTHSKVKNKKQWNDYVSNKCFKRTTESQFYPNVFPPFLHPPASSTVLFTFFSSNLTFSISSLLDLETSAVLNPWFRCGTSIKKDEKKKTFFNSSTLHCPLFQFESKIEYKLSILPFSKKKKKRLVNTFLSNTRHEFKLKKKMIIRM